MTMTWGVVVGVRPVRRLLVQALLTVEVVVQHHQGRVPNPGSDRGEKHGRHAVMGVLAPAAWEMAMRAICAGAHRGT